MMDTMECVLQCEQGVGETEKNDSYFFEHTRFSLDCIPFML